MKAKGVLIVVEGNTGGDRAREGRGERVRTAFV